MKIFALNHVLKSNQTVVFKRVENGKTTYKPDPVIAGAKYELGNIDEKSLREKTTDVNYSQQAEEYLKQEGVDFKVVVTCKSCGRKKIRVKTFEIFDVDPEEWERKQNDDNTN